VECAGEKQFLSVLDFRYSKEDDMENWLSKMSLISMGRLFTVETKMLLYSLGSGFFMASMSGSANTDKVWMDFPNLAALFCK
jgi:hypothetical protein